MYTKLLISLLILFSSTVVMGQALSQDELLYSFEMEFISPVEQTVESIGSGTYAYFRHQMGVNVDDGSSKVLVSFYADDGAHTPHVIVPTTVATLATNDEDYVIKMISPSSDDRELLNADWAAHAYFTPKKGRGKYSNGKLTTLYREGVGLVHIYYLYNDELPYGELFRFMDLE